MQPNPYDDLITGMDAEDQRAAQMRVSMLGAVDANPDEEAELRHLAQRYGLPVDGVRFTLPETRARARFDAVDYDTLARELPATSGVVADPELARLAHDDVDNMGQIERKLRQLGGGFQEAVGMAIHGTGALLGVAQRTATNAAAALLPAPRPGPGTTGQLPGPTRESLAGPSDISEGWLELGGSVKDYARNQTMVPQQAQTFSDQVAGGLGQLAGQVAMFATGGAAAGTAGLYAQGASSMSDKIAGDQQATQAEKDLAIALGATVTGVTEKWALDKVLGPVAEPLKNAVTAGLARIGIAAVSEGGQELAENVLQDAVRQQLTNPDAEIELGQALQEGGVGAAVGGLARSLVEAALHVRTRGAHRQQQAAQAEETAATLAELNQAASQSRLLPRDAQAFEQFADHAAEGGQLYIDARALLQSGLSGPLSAVSPSVAAQLDAAAATGGVIAIPGAEYTARIAPTELAPALVDHLRADPEGVSLAEARAGQALEQEQLEREFDQAAQQVEEEAARQGEQLAVRQRIQAELDATGRFTPQANEAYAALTAAYYARRADMLGLTAEELYERRPLQVAAQGVLQESALPQALAAQPPRGWQHSTSGEDAAKLWEGLPGVEAVFWTDMKGRLAQEAPELAEFSHSLGRSTIKHIQKNHGGLQTEGLRGQLPVTQRDVARVPEIVTNYDHIRTDLQSEQGAQRVAYTKKFDDGVLLYIEDVSRGRSDMRGVTMRKYSVASDPASLLKNTLRVAAKNKDPAAPDSATGSSGSTLRPLSDDQSDAQTPPPPTSVEAYAKDGQAGEGYPQPDGTANPNNLHQDARGFFNPETLQIALLKNADLSTWLHESGHFFFENDIALASGLVRVQRLGEDLTEGERRLLDDVSSLLRWHGLQGGVTEQLQAWHSMSFDERRAHHERTAESFERYLMDGDAPSLELAPYFQKFRAWLLNVYQSLKDFLARHPQAGTLSPEVRRVFDRMLASDEQIRLAQQSRSMAPLFATAQEAGMTPEAFEAYHAQGEAAAASATEYLQARALRDLQWARNAHARELKKLQQQARFLREATRVDVMQQMQQEPLWRTWRFLTNRITEEDRLPPSPGKPKATHLAPEHDSLLVAIAKLGGLSRESAHDHLGVHADDFRVKSGVFGKPVFRKTGGLPADAMAERLLELGYLRADEYGKHDLRELEERIAQELGGDPHYSFAHDWAETQGEMRAGDQAANPWALGAGRLDLAELKAMNLPEDVVQTLQARRMTSARGGLHPDIMAELFGFTSGDELVRALAAAPDIHEEVEDRVDAWLLQEHGELATPEALEREADRAIQNEARARMVATEANALARAVGQRKVASEQARALAEAQIARVQVRHLRPSLYSNLQTRAARAAQAAMRAGDLMTAGAEKRNELVQTYAARAAHEARAEIDRGLRYLRKFEGDTKGLDADYREQIDTLLERFDLRKSVSGKAIDKRASLLAWVAQQREAGLEPDISADLLDEARRQSYKTMTVEQFRGLVDTVRQIEHLGRLKRRLLTDRQQREYAAIRDSIADSINEHAHGRVADTRTATTTAGRALQSLKRFGAAHIKAATWARVMDGGKDGGPVWEHIIRTANERADMESTMRADATQQLAALLAPLRKLGPMGGKGIYFPTLGSSLNRENRLAIALNTGNASNLQRLLGGEGWTQQQIAPVLQSLTSAEWQAVQGIWDHFESYRPLIGAKEKRIYGKEPEWVQATPLQVVTADGLTLQLRGGYYPVQYDPAASQRAEEHGDAEAARRQLQGAYTSATTRRSFTKARAEEVKGRPLLYALTGVYSGVNDVIHDLAWHEWLIDTNRLLRSHRIDEAMRSHWGPQAKQQFKSWVQDIAEGDKGAQSAVDMALGRLRQGVSVAGLGFNVISAAMQPLGLTQSIVRIGAGWTGRGIARYIARPFGLTREINEKSAFMRNRSRTRFRELNELRNMVQDQSGWREVTGRYAYWMMMRVQQAVDVPTWQGAYEKAVAEGNDEERAIALADQAVIDSQGGGETKDLSAIERGGPAQRLFTVYYSFMNTALNLGAGQAMSAYTPRQKAKLAADMLLLYTIPAVLGAALKDALIPGGDDDDDETLARKLAAEQISYLLGLLVVAREFGEAGKLMTGAQGPRGYSGPSGVRVVSDALRFGQQASQGEFDDAFRKAAVNLLGSAFGLPAAQINRSWTGAQALLEGETDNPAALAMGYQR
jgi:hypothetical protein